MLWSLYGWVGGWEDVPPFKGFLHEFEGAFSGRKRRVRRGCVVPHVLCDLP